MLLAKSSQAEICFCALPSVCPNHQTCLSMHRQHHTISCFHMLTHSPFSARKSFWLAFGEELIVHGTQLPNHPLLPKGTYQTYPTLFGVLIRDSHVIFSKGGKRNTNGRKYHKQILITRIILDFFFFLSEKTLLFYHTWRG